MKTNIYLTVLACLIACLAVPVQSASAADVQEIIEQTGVKAGLVVQLGCGNGELAAALAAREGFLVHALDADPRHVAAARELIRSKNLCRRASAERLSGDRLPYVDNLVNLLVAEDLGRVTIDEVIRVLVPQGMAYVKRDGAWTSIRKPRPAEIDDWTHYLYDATNNAVADDALVGPPRRVQWKASPTFARHHDVLASVTAAVSSAGRVFTIIDEAPTSLMSFPADWQLVARDAFNGTLLWKRPIPTWANYLRAFRSGPPQLPRRLVAMEDAVYVTLGLDAPLVQLDAATGETRKTYEGSEGTDEILLCDGVLVLVAFEAAAWADAKAAGRRGVPSAVAPRRLLAVEADSGKALWRRSGDETAGLQRSTVAAAADRVVFQAGQEVRCVELKTGKDVWRRPIDRAAASKPKKPSKRGGFGASFYAPTLVLGPEHNVALSADRGKLAALDLGTGEILWSCPCTPDFHAPADVFLADGLVWSGLFAVEGRDPRSGEVKRRLDIEGLLTPGHHPRCYRNKATQRYVISDKRGMEFFDLTGEKHERHNWARGACQYGVMPCNGLMYLPPNACCCYAGAMLHAFYALAAEGEEKGEGREEKGEGRLEKGPAYGQAIHPSSFILHPSVDWPTFRGDAVRRGATAVNVPSQLTAAWEAEIGGKLSAPVVAGGKVFVASVDLGRIHALDAETGKPAWSFTAGGRVDTPPTIHAGLALFGSADGYVYCLRASDGELVWRFRAAPQDRRIVVDERLESVWPVCGSVLLHDATAYAAAGRSTYLDGGIQLVGLDPVTGALRCRTRAVTPNDEDETGAFIMAGARGDVLVTDGKYLYLQHLKYDAQLQRQPGLGRHLMAHSGLADDSWFYRTFWRLGYGDAYDFPNSYIKHSLQAPFGQLLVFDDALVCGVQTFFSPGIVPGAVVDSSRGCLLFGDANTPMTPDKTAEPSRDYPPDARRSKGPKQHRWTAKLPFQARAMLLSGDTLFVAGWVDAIEEADPYAGPQGRNGGVLWTFAADTGEKLAAAELDSPPRFDAMAAARGRLYVATIDGKLRCLTGHASRGNDIAQ